MTIETRSSFIYGIEVLENFKTFFIDEGVGVISIDFDVAEYTLTDIGTETSTKLNAGTTQAYTIAIDRATRLMTISAAGNFDLLLSTSSNNVFSVLGFTSDKTGSNSYVSDVAIGSEYRPQFKLQNFVDFDRNKKAVSGVVSRSPSGVTRASDFGVDKIMKCDFAWITDLQVGVIEFSATGIADTMSFMDNAISKAPMEFLPDRDTVATFTKCLLDASGKDKSGLSYELQELYGKGLPNLYRLKGLQFREIS